jgi:hypothetical protein
MNRFSVCSSSGEKMTDISTLECCMNTNKTLIDECNRLCNNRNDCQQSCNTLELNIASICQKHAFGYIWKDKSPYAVCTRENKCNIEDMVCVLKNKKTIEECCIKKCASLSAKTDNINPIVDCDKQCDTEYLQRFLLSNVREKPKMSYGLKKITKSKTRFFFFTLIVKIILFIVFVWVAQYLAHKTLLS